MELMQGLGIGIAIIPQPMRIRISALRLFNSVFLLLSIVPHLLVKNNNSKIRAGRARPNARWRNKQKGFV